ncbi:MAG TPA: hypothetical protein VF316_08960, partial [Polyangiaceae bacterium]
MSELSFDLVGWLGPADGDEAARATMGSLRISAGENLGVPVTEVEDTIGQTVRSHINVPLYSVAEWLLMNWWRLRWEGRPDKPTSDWRQTHCLAGIGGDHAWPGLEFSSDGEFIQLHMEAEDASDVSAIRYLRRVTLDVPASDFEAAVDRLVDVVEARLGTLLPQHRALTELRAELSDERKRPSVAKTCRWQALAGIDPGAASEEWVEAARTLVEEAGATAGEEIMTVLPELDHGIPSAESLVDAMKRSTTAVDLTWATSTSPLRPRELPWQRGVRLAQEIRAHHHLGDGPLSDEKLSDLLSTNLPLQGQRSRGPLGGGFRNAVAGGRTKIVVTSSHPMSQRFYLARMIGAALVLAPDQHLVPVTTSYSALQKLERAFAQEFLCPWAALDAFTDEHGVDDDDLIEAAEYFRVSEFLVRTALVNRGKVS